MVWTLAAAVALGFLLGLRFKVPALLAATALVAVAAAASSLAGHRPVADAALVALGSAAVLQAGYLAGLLLGRRRRRGRLPRGR